MTGFLYVVSFSNGTVKVGHGSPECPWARGLFPVDEERDAQDNRDEDATA